jgi:tetratricopeptide (TPR) repeat protein
LEKGIEFITKYSVIEDSTLYLVEEFFYAALEVKQMEWARLFLQIIGNKIPQTPKHMRLLAMFHEAIQDFDKAKEIYNELISVNGSDFQTVKRLVALERDRGKINEAIVLLNKYLENNQQDHEAWLELTDLFLSKHNYEKA